MPTKSLRPTAKTNAGQQLKVQQLLIPEIEQLQQKELQAQQQLTIKKPTQKTPKRQSKPQLKPTVKPTQKKPSNRLEAPYQQSKVQPVANTPTRTVTFGNTTLVLPRDQHKLEKLKQEAVEYWKNLPDIE